MIGRIPLTPLWRNFGANRAQIVCDALVESNPKDGVPAEFLEVLSGSFLYPSQYPFFLYNSIDIDKLARVMFNVNLSNHLV